MKIVLVCVIILCSAEIVRGSVFISFQGQNSQTYNLAEVGSYSLNYDSSCFAVINDNVLNDFGTVVNTNVGDAMVNIEIRLSEIVVCQDTDCVTTLVTGSCDMINIGCYTPYVSNNLNCFITPSSLTTTTTTTKAPESSTTSSTVPPTITTVSPEPVEPNTKVDANYLLDHSIINKTILNVLNGTLTNMTTTTLNSTTTNNFNISLLPVVCLNIEEAELELKFEKMKGYKSRYGFCNFHTKLYFTGIYNYSECLLPHKKLEDNTTIIRYKTASHWITQIALILFSFSSDLDVSADAECFNKLNHDKLMDDIINDKLSSEDVAYCNCLINKCKPHFISAFGKLSIDTRNRSISKSRLECGAGSNSSLSVSEIMIMLLLMLLQILIVDYC